MYHIVSQLEVNTKIKRLNIKKDISHKLIELIVFYTLKLYAKTKVFKTQ